MKDYNIGVHQTHCCMKHGCKYGDDDCPVVLKRTKQEYPCSNCSLLDEFGEINPPQQWKLPDEWDLMPNGKYFFWRFGASNWENDLWLKQNIQVNPDCFWSAYGPIVLPATTGHEKLPPIDSSDYSF